MDEQKNKLLLRYYKINEILKNPNKNNENGIIILGEKFNALYSEYMYIQKILNIKN